MAVTGPATAAALKVAGVQHWEAQRYRQAAHAFAQAVAAAPEDAEAHYDLGTALAALARHREAIASFASAGALRPDYASAHWNRGLSHLALGEYAPGFALAEWRWQTAGFAPGRRTFAAPPWRGEDLAGKTILLHAEQGLGDTIQFCRYVPLVAARGARVILEVPAALRPLVLALEGADVVVSTGGPLPPFDLQCALPDLPLAFGTGLSTIPAEAPYLRAPGWLPAESVAGLRATAPRCLVGLVWRGNPANRHDRRRSVKLAQLAPLLAIDDVRFVSLQHDLTDEESAIVATTGGRLVHRGQGFAETAATAAALDLVITVDTSWAHWAGAIGLPVWVMLPFAPDWRWLLDRDDSPWYPTARLFRQPAPGDWEAVVRAVSSAMAVWQPQVRPQPARPAGVDDAIAFYRAGQLDDAVRACQAVLERRPSAFEALHLSGLIAATQGRFADALVTLQQALAINPVSEVVRRDLAKVTARIG